MEVELEPRVKPLGFKVKAMSRESASQKASHLLDTDLRNHWSTGTNTKEWILLELDEPCLLSHIRIHNKSVLEWDISAGLQYKPETFIKVRPRCEAPRRDMIYPVNYTPCRYVRLSCLRGNPIAIYFIQLIGISVPGLEPEFLPVVNHLLPDIIGHKQDGPGVHLQFLQDMTSRLATFLPHLELDLNNFPEAPESTLRFLAMLVGPFYPILQRVNERCTNNISYLEASKAGQASSSFVVSSNFEPRRSRPSPSIIPTSSYFVFRPDVVFTCLRRAYKDSNLGKVCRMASRILLKLTEPITEKEMSTSISVSKTLSSPVFSDYSVLFGEEFQVADDQWDVKFLNILDIASVEEGIFHILYACASQPLLCSKLADVTSDFWSALPLVHALLPALRPNISSLDHIDDNFSQWKQPYVQHALSQVVATSSSPVYRPLLRACSGYLSSFSPSHAKAASVLIDLCSGVLAPWIPQVVAKVDLAVELLEDLLGILQATQHSLAHARAALKCIVLALSGHIDDMMSKFKIGKLRILFLLEMLEPYLDPVMTPMKSTIAFGNVSSTLLENQEHNCDIALNIIRTALNKSAVLPSIEAEWRRGSVAPSVLLAILEPHIQLPPDIDLRKFPAPESQSSTITVPIPFHPNGKPLIKTQGLDSLDGKTVSTDIAKMDVSEDASLLFAPPELCRMSLTYNVGSIDSKGSEGKHSSSSSSQSQIAAALDGVDTMESLNLKSDYVQLLNYRECELRASEFRRLALDLQSHSQITPEGEDATVESLLLAAECYVNPYFQSSFKSPGRISNQRIAEEASRNYKLSDIREVLPDSGKGLEIVSDLERKRDKIVLEILLEAAELDKKYHKLSLNGGAPISYDEGNGQVTVLSEQDILSADAITLVRQNQSLLCNFLVQRLHKEEQLMHEILIQSLLFYLNSATRLFCSPECIVDIILKSAEHLNGLLRSFNYKFKEGRLQLDQSKLLKVQRHWMLLQKLVIASTEYCERPNLLTSVRSGPRITNLLPPSAWLQKVPVFSSSSSPLVRFFGWMAVSRNAKQYLNERLFLVSDLTQLTYLLAIFSDDLVLVQNIIEQKDKSVDAQGTGLEQDTNIEKENQLSDRYYADQSLHAIYPDISHMFPDLKEDFKAFGETLLEAVGMQLRSIPSSDVPDMLCWFSDLCKWPFAQGRTGQVFSEERSAHFKGFASKNAKAVILYILEAILTEHIEAVVPEIPRMVQVILSLCSSKYCDVSFLDAILRLLKPVISYSLREASDQENLSIDDSCHTFESLCFDELLLNIEVGGENQSSSINGQHNRALTIFVLASVFPELSAKYKNEILKSSAHWAKFASIEPTTFFHDYLCAYQVLLDNCKEFLIHNLRIHGVIPVTMSVEPNLDIGVAADDKSSAKPWFLGDIVSSTELLKESQNKNGNISLMNEKLHHHMTDEETSTFCRYLETLISQLYSTIEQCCNLHPKISKTLARTVAECFVYLKYLSLTVEKVTVDVQSEKERLHVLENAVSGTEVITNVLDQIPDHLRFSLEGFAETILQLQENRCWEIASLMLDCLLEVSRWFSLGTVTGKVCVAMMNFSCSAPNISWRLRTDDWMSILFTTGLQSIDGSEGPLIDLFSALLGHPEPELQFIALKHMTNLLGKNMDLGLAYFSSELLNGVASVDIPVSVSKQILSTLVSKIWDQVTLLASASTSWRLRIHGVAVLIKSIPFTERQKLQSFLASSDSVLQSLARHPQLAGEGQSSKFALALVASACLYSPAEDIDLIPDDVWTIIETLGEPQNGKGLIGHEQKICKALCRLKNEGEVAKQNLEEALSLSSSEQQCPNFGGMRESILQVLSHLSSTQSYFEFFSKEIDQKSMEFEEAEIEMELLQRELAIQEPSHEVKASPNVENRLEQIKDEIRSLEKAKLREEIMERRQKKLGLRRARKKYLEEAALREAELLKELDSEKTAEMEKEIERQRLLETERAKTRELRHNLDIEKEKQIQRDLQREFEQVESGLRAPRRDFSSSNHNRVRDSRYRERENGRAVNEGNLRTSSSNNLQPENISGNSSVGTMPKIVLSGGARQFSGPPTILQSHDRSDECGSSYEENFEGSRDSGDTGSVGDPEMVSSLDGQSGYGSGQRHGSRGSKSRPVVERREREGRREGKWERKH